MRNMQRVLMAVTAAAFLSLPAGAQTLNRGDVVVASPIAPFADDDRPTSRIIGGGTQVTLTAADALTGLGLSFAPFGTASIVPSSGDPIVNFLITGGFRNNETGALLVQHDGSGLDFSAGGSTLRIGDFEIDTAASLIRGSVFANGAAVGIVPLFDLTSDLQLLLSDDAAGAFTSVFGAPDLAGTVIGSALVVPVFAAVPEPASWTLMIGGFALAGAAVRRRAPARVLA